MLPGRLTLYSRLLFSSWHEFLGKLTIDIGFASHILHCEQ